MNNLYNTNTTVLGSSIEGLQDRLDAVILVLKGCIGDTCLHPWAALHPGQNIETLVDALNPGYNEFYRNQRKVEYQHCEAGYRMENEMPFVYNVYRNTSTKVPRFGGLAG
jgi:hypothetical protein